MRIVLHGKKAERLSRNTSEIRDQQMSRFICAYFLFGLLDVAIKITFPMSESTWNMISFVLGAVLAILAVVPFVSVFKREKNMLILSELIAAMMYLFSALMGNAKNVSLLSELFTTVAVAIPIGVYTCAVRDKGILYDTLLKGAYAAVAITLVNYYLLMVRGDNRTYDMMMPTYYLIFAATLWSAVISKRKRTVLTICLAVYSVLYLLFFGNRGSLLCLGFFIGLRLIRIRGGKNKPILIILFIILLAVGIALMEPILTWMSSLLESMGRSSYILWRIANGSFLDSNGRFELFEHYWNLIKQKPLFGWGVYGGYISLGSGPHNGAIELLLAFGFVLGGPIVLYFAGVCIAAALSHEDGSVETELLIILVAMNAMRYISTGSMLTNPYVAMFLFLYWQRRRQKLRQSLPVKAY